MTNHQIEDLETRKRILRERIQQTEKLKQKVSSSQISELNKLKLSRYYDECIEVYEAHIKLTQKKINKILHGPLITKAIIIAILLAIVLTTLFLIVTIEKGELLLGPPTTETYSQNINLETETPTNYLWELENKGQLTSLKISGSFIDSGNAKIYLIDTENQKHLILDTINLGLFLSPTNESNQTPPEENITLPEQEITEPETNETLPEQNQTPINETQPETNQTLPGKNTTAPIQFEVSFSEICEDTCNLESLNLTGDFYTLEIETQNTTITLHTITYDILTQEEIIIPEENTTETNATEQNITIQNEIPTKKGKKIDLEIPEGKENELATIEIPESWNIREQKNLKLNSLQQKTDIFFKTIDSDNNGLIDKIEFIPESTGQQSFEIIIITKAEYLNSNREFISNIYEEVKELDNIWSLTIQENGFVRVTFAKPLTNENDITIYPKIISGNPKIEIYEIDSNEKITEFTNLIENQYNKIFLTNLISQTQDVFDLRVIGGSIQFDHIIDPPQQEFFEDCANIGEWTVSNGWASLLDTCRDFRNPPLSTMDSPTIDLSASNINSATLNFDYDHNKLKASDGDYFAVYVKNSESGWIEVFRNSDNNPGKAEIPLKEYINLDSEVQIRGECQYKASNLLCLWDNINITTDVNLINQPPVISVISIEDPVNLITGSPKPVNIQFEIMDPNGYSDIIDSSLAISFNHQTTTETRTGDYTNCIISNDGSNTKTYSCNLIMMYYDSEGIWNISIGIEDSIGQGDSTSSTLEVNPLIAFTLTPPEGISFSGVQPGESSQTSSSDTTITNLGNQEIPGDSNLWITSRALFGQTNPSFSIPGDNFRSASSTESGTVCTVGGVGLIQDTSVVIPAINLVKGTDTTPLPTETIKHCLVQVPAIPQQEYSTSGFLAWDIEIIALMIFIVPKRRKKKPSKKSKLNNKKFLKFLNENLEELVVYVKASKIKAKIENTKIPLDIFKQNLSPAEAVCKFLKENKNLKFSEIAIALNRNQRTIWINYRNANKKQKQKFQKTDTSSKIPISILQNRNLSILESIVLYLKNSGMENKKISKSIGKSTNNIWTLNKRARKKLNQHNQ